MAKQLAEMSADPLFPLELVTAQTAVVPDDAGKYDDDDDDDEGEDGDEYDVKITMMMLIIIMMMMMMIIVMLMIGYVQHTFIM